MSTLAISPGFTRTRSRVTARRDVVARPVRRPAGRPDTARPATRPVSRSAALPVSAPVACPGVRPVAGPVARPVARPGARAAAARRPAPASSLRLTRRGRLLVTLTMLGMLLAGFTAFGTHSAATDRPGTPVPTRTVEVGQGDSLWSIASQVAAPGETRAMVHQIEELNALSGPGVRVGQEIAVPVG